MALPKLFTSLQLAGLTLLVFALVLAGLFGLRWAGIWNSTSVYTLTFGGFAVCMVLSLLAGKPPASAERRPD